jgi:hypothetical protein
MHFFYQSTFLVLAATTGLLEYLKAHGAPKPFSTNNSFLSFRNNYLLVYSLMMGATQSAPHCGIKCNSCVFGTIAGDAMLRYQLPLHVLGAVLVEYLNAHGAPKPYATNNGFLTLRKNMFVYSLILGATRSAQHPDAHNETHVRTIAGIATFAVSPCPTAEEVIWLRTTLQLNTHAAPSDPLCKAVVGHVQRFCISNTFQANNPHQLAQCLQG